MISEQLLVKRYLGARFGYAEVIPTGIYAIPCDTSKGEAFMKFTCNEHGGGSEGNFSLFWDEDLTISWHNEQRMVEANESGFSFHFRQLMKQI